MAMHDLLIRGALLCDGLGGEPATGDLAVDGERIAAVGGRLGPARETVDADGLALAPGIVDIHTHYDAQATWDPTLRPSPGLGVTTVVIGNCGFTIAPCRPEHRDLTLRNLTHVEGMSLDALREGVRWDFQTFAEYLDALARVGPVANVASFAGHSSIRLWVMGGAALERAARPDEIAAMRELALAALRSGAIGIGTSTLEFHNGENGVPVASRFAAHAEFEALAGALAEAGTGVFQITKGATTPVPFLERIAALSGRPVHVCAMLVEPAWPERVFAEMEAIAAAQARGHALYGQTSPFPESLEFDLAHAFPLEAVAAWKPAMEASGPALRAVLADPSFRAAVRAELATPGGPGRFGGTWRHVTVKRAARPEHAAWVGRTVAELAAAEAKDPLDWLLDAGLAEDLATGFEVLLLNADEARTRDLLLHPASVVGLGDAGAHLTFFCQAGTGLYLLQRYVRERGYLTLPRAIRELTSRPADLYGIRDRGRLAPGAFADLFLFDPTTVGLGPRRLVRDLPAGAARLETPAEGLHGVWVNGRRVADARGIDEAARGAGRVLRHFAA
jgi:N-acyl-D-aspartate/D-glutamate deacylase